MKFIDTIKALLAKAASTDNPHEAEAFAAKAYALMDKYQVDANMLVDAGDEVGHAAGYTTKEKKPVWQNRVAYATGLYFGCDCIHSYNGGGTETVFFGRESSRVTALEMLPYFIGTINRLAREMVARGEAVHQRATANRIGLEFAHRLRSLAPKREEAITLAGGNALVLLNQQIALKESMFPNAVAMKKTRFTTTAACRDAANSIGLNRQAGTTKRMALA